MAAASQAASGEFDSRRLLQVSIIRTIYKLRVNGSDFLFIFENRIFLLFLAQINIHFGIKYKIYILMLKILDFWFYKRYNVIEKGANY